MRKIFIVLSITAVAAVLFALLPAGSTLSQQFREVRVLNFPNAQRIEGKVKVEEPIPHSKFVRRVREIVPPVTRSEITNFVQAGTIDMEGFSRVALSLQGEVRGTLYRGGTAGAILIPDEKPIIEALETGDRLQFPIEVKSQVTLEAAPFFSGQVQKPIAFPRYRVYFYNSSDKSVEANLYIYLTH